MGDVYMQNPRGAAPAQAQPSGQSVPPVDPKIAAAAPVIDYFVKLGISPEIATQLATRVSSMEMAPAPLSNGIKVAPHEAVSGMLQSKYGLRDDEAAAVADSFSNPAVKSGMGPRGRNGTR